MWEELYEKLKALLESRRFLAAATTIILVVLQDIVGLPIDDETLTTVIQGIWVWIIGDSVKETTSPKLQAVQLKRRNGK